MFVAISHFNLANETHDAVAEEAFQQRPRQVDTTPGFRRMEVWKRDESVLDFVIVTWRKKAADFRTWHRDRAFKDAHRQMTKGLMRVSGSTRIKHYSLLCE